MSQVSNAPDIILDDSEDEPLPDFENIPEWTGPPETQRPQFNWNFVYYLTEASTWACNAAFVILLWLKVEGSVTCSWHVVFHPLIISTGASVAAQAFALSMILRDAYHQPRREPEHGQDLMRRLVLFRNLCECLFKLLQAAGLLCIASRLPSYVQGAFSRGIKEPVDGSFALGSNIDDGARVSINHIMVPLWVAWACEVALWLAFEQIKVRKYFNRAHFMTGRLSNRFLRLHLLSIVRKVVLRPNARTFAHNLHLTLVAQMVSGAYSFNWATVFVAAWVHYSLLGLFLLYLGLLGCICTILDAVHHSRRGKAYLKTLLAAFGGASVFIISVFSIVCNFVFFLALARRLDGNDTISNVAIFAPLVAHYVFSTVLGPIRYGVVQREAAADESVLLLWDAHASASRAEQQEALAWEQERLAYVPPLQMLMHSGTLFRAKSQILPVTALPSSGDDKPPLPQPREGDSCDSAAAAADGGQEEQGLRPGVADDLEDAQDREVDLELGGRSSLSSSSAAAARTPGLVPLRAGAPPRPPLLVIPEQQQQQQQQQAWEASSSVSNAVPGDVLAGEGGLAQAGSLGTEARPGATAAGGGGGECGGSGAIDSPGSSSSNCAVDLDSVEQLLRLEEASWMEGECQICYEDDAVANCVLLPCGHGGVCRDCAEQVVARDSQCHMCRAKVLRVAELARVGVDPETGLVEVAVTPTQTGLPATATRSSGSNGGGGNLQDRWDAMP